MSNGQWATSRGVVERILITGTLILDTPTHFGNGDTEGLTDIPLLRDPLEGVPLLTGASIAGALRNYVREYDGGFGTVEKQNGATRAERLFGHLMQDKASVSSWLFVDDTLGHLTSVELRDGVAIDAGTRTAEDKKKYDVELLGAGTTFDLSFELWLNQAEQDRGQLLSALVTALRGLEKGEIGLGQRKRRGYGQCHVENWRTRRYAMGTDLLAWLENDPAAEQAGLPEVTDTPPAWCELRVQTTFALASSLLIRSGSGQANSPDMVHLHSKREGQDKPVLSGTSAAGAIRARALRIANTMLGREWAKILIDDMFGKRIETAKDDPSGSRVLVREAEITEGLADWVQSRVKLDRFTGGSFPTALFSQQPIWGKPDHSTHVVLDLRLRRPAQGRPADFEAQAGLLLLVLKDLWTGDLPLGGESSVGRGRLIGQDATITCGGRSGKAEYEGKTWKLTGEEQLAFDGDGKPEMLEEFVQAFLNWTPAENEVNDATRS